MDSPTADQARLLRTQLAQAEADLHTSAEAVAQHLSSLSPADTELVAAELEKLPDIPKGSPAQLWTHDAARVPVVKAVLAALRSHPMLESALDYHRRAQQVAYLTQVLAGQTPDPIETETAPAPVAANRFVRGLGMLDDGPREALTERLNRYARQFADIFPAAMMWSEPMMLPWVARAAHEESDAMPVELMEAATEFLQGIERTFPVEAPEAPEALELPDELDVAWHALLEALAELTEESHAAIQTALEQEARDFPGVVPLELEWTHPLAMPWLARATARAAQGGHVEAELGEKAEAFTQALIAAGREESRRARLAAAREDLELVLEQLPESVHQAVQQALERLQAPQAEDWKDAEMLPWVAQALVECETSGTAAPYHGYVAREFLELSAPPTADPDA